MVSSIIVVLVIYCQSPLHSNSNKELNFMPPKKDSLQLLIDNFEKNTANYDKINQLLDVKSKDDNVHEKN